MTIHPGGSETPEKIRECLKRYSRDSAMSKIHMFACTLNPDTMAVGSMGYWEKEWQGQPVWETGWRILPGDQGHGITTQAITLMVEYARTERKHRFIHAFPSIDHISSNAIGLKTGLVLQAEVDFEYPPGIFMRSDDRCLDRVCQ